MNVLIMGEYSGITRDAFIAKGHNAVSCDFRDTERPGPHHKGNVLEIISDGWDLMIGHPDCNKLAFSGEQWRTPDCKTYKKGEFKKRLKALIFFKQLMAAPIDKICLENSHSIFLNKYYRVSDQYIQPWQFGDPYQKETHLWLKNLPPLMYTQIMTKREPLCWKMGSGKSKERAKTYPGIANAMAEQWG